MELLILFGLGVGLFAGFFGVGGGAILVPLLLSIGYTIKEAVGISLIQMLFSSVWGSWLNFKKGKLKVQIIVYLGVGGWIGSFMSPYLVQTASETFLESLFLLFIVLSIIKLFYAPVAPASVKTISTPVLVLFGVFVGLTSSSIGVGGAILIIPFLNGYLGYPLKTATAASLFFVTFSSLSATISWSLTQQILYEQGIIVGISSLLGVYLGITLAHIFHLTAYKVLLLLLNSLIFVYILNRLI